MKKFSTCLAESRIDASVMECVDKATADRGFISLVQRPVSSKEVMKATTGIHYKPSPARRSRTMVRPRAFGGTLIKSQRVSQSGRTRARARAVQFYYT